MGKDSVLLYITITADLIDGLTREQRGDILTAIVQYKRGEELPEMDDVTQYVFFTIKKHIDRNEEQYAETCEKRRAAGKAGAVKRWQNIANDSKCQENIANDSKNGKTPKTIAKIADNDNDNENENENENDIEKRNNKLFPKKEDGETVAPALSGETDLTAAQAGKATKKKFVPPTREDVRAYAIQRGREDLAQPFFDFFDTGDWHDSNGKPVRNWKQKFLTWETHNPKKETPKQEQETTEPRKTAFFWEGD